MTGLIALSIILVASLGPAFCFVGFNANFLAVCGARLESKSNMRSGCFEILSQP